MGKDKENLAGFFLALTALGWFIPGIAWPICNPEGAKMAVIFQKLVMAMGCASVALLTAMPFREPWRSRIAVVWTAIFTLFLAIDAFCLARFNVPFTPTFVPILMGTNGGEILEFFKQGIPWECGLWLLLGCGLAAVGWWGGSRMRIPRKALLTVFVVTSAALVWALWANRKMASSHGGSPVSKAIAMRHLHREHDIIPTCPRVEVVDPEAPHDIIMIIGESLKPSHMSLYGYEIPTTPRLDSIARAGALVAYIGAVSPAYHTIASFKRFMSTYDGDDSISEWYNSVTLIDLARAAGYRTVWISNQNKAGIYDNVITRFAVTADTALWTKTKPLGSVTLPGYDEKVLPLLERIMATDTVPTLWIVHLMGSHNFFSQRYPLSRHRFKAAQYTSRYNAKAAAQVAAYDNSVAYNDSVVAEILRRFDNRDAMALYFSDHGLDLYESSPHTYTHGVVGNAKSMEAAKPIPFMVYASPEALRRRPRLLKPYSDDAMDGIDTDTLTRLLTPMLGIKLSP